jgi:hypothetical protein
MRSRSINRDVRFSTTTRFGGRVTKPQHIGSEEASKLLADVQKPRIAILECGDEVIVKATASRQIRPIPVGPWRGGDVRLAPASIFLRSVLCLRLQGGVQGDVLT